MKDLLAWKDIQITRANGAFVARVTFKRLKGKADDPVWESRRPHTLYFRSVSTIERFTLSIPERLLVELLDRDFLKHYPRNDPSSLRRILFEGNEHSIAMKEEALEQFVFYDPTSSSATTRNGLPVGDLNTYIHQRFQLFGFQSTHSFYDLRGQAGTMIEREMGVETARKVLSPTYRKHYDKGLDHVDMVGAIVDGTDAIFDDEIAEPPEVLPRGNHHQLPAIETMTDLVIARAKQDKIPFPVSKRARPRTVCKIYTDIVDEQLQAQTANSSIDEIDIRKQAMGKSRLITQMQDGMGALGGASRFSPNIVHTHARPLFASQRFYRRLSHISRTSTWRPMQVLSKSYCSERFVWGIPKKRASSSVIPIHLQSRSIMESHPIK